MKLLIVFQVSDSLTLYEISAKLLFADLALLTITVYEAVFVPFSAVTVIGISTWLSFAGIEFVIGLSGSVVPAVNASPASVIVYPFVDVGTSNVHVVESVK